MGSITFREDRVRSTWNSSESYSCDTDSGEYWDLQQGAMSLDVRVNSMK